MRGLIKWIVNLFRTSGKCDSCGKYSDGDLIAYECINDTPFLTCGKCYKELNKNERNLDI